MPGSDRLEEEKAEESPATEAAEATQEPPAEAAAESAEAPPARPARTRRSRASSTAQAAEAPTEASEEAAPAAPRPRRASRRKQAEEEPQPEPEAPVRRVPRLLEQYRSRVRDTMQQEFSYKNVMQIPHVEKVVLNIGLGETKQNPRALESATRDLSLISAQKPVTTRARRSIAGFKLRQGDAIGTSVTLRGHRMYDFIDRLFNAALPRIRDFRGVSRRAFDGRGNYSLGLREQIIFPEIDYGSIDRIRGFQVSFITTASTDREAMRLLELMGMPFARDGAQAGGSDNV